MTPRPGGKDNGLEQCSRSLRAPDGHDAEAVYDGSSLLALLCHIVRPGGTIAVEVDARASGVRLGRARLERGPEVGGWFPWAVVGADALPTVALAAGLVHRGTRHVDGRPVGMLARPLGRAA